jgi:hypothetical protein
MGAGGQRHAPATLPPGKRAGNNYIGGWVGPRAGLDECGNSRPPPTEIPSPDLPARSKSLYRLSYPGPSYKFSHRQKRSAPKRMTLDLLNRTGGLT